MQYFKSIVIDLSSKRPKYYKNFFLLKHSVLWKLSFEHFLNRVLSKRQKISCRLLKTDNEGQGSEEYSAAGLRCDQRQIRIHGTEMQRHDNQQDAHRHGI